VCSSDLVKGKIEGSTLRARVTAGQGLVQVGTAPQALGDDCVIANGALYVKGVASNEVLAQTGCEITITENNVELQKLQPKVYDKLDLPIHAWKVTLSGEDEDFQGIQICGEDMDLDRVMDDVAATWRTAGINVQLAEVTELHLKVDLEEQDIAVQVEQALKENVLFSIDSEAVRLVFVPVYERFGLTFTRYSRKETAPQEMSKDGNRQKGFSSPMAIIGVNGFKKPDGSWGSRSKDTRALDGQDRQPTQEDKDFHYLSLSSDTAHELGHLLSLPHVSNAPSQTQVKNPQSSYLFSQLMNSQVATPIRNLVSTEVQNHVLQNQNRLEAAKEALRESNHPKTQLGEMRNSNDTPSTYSTQRGAVITDQFAQFARNHIRTCQVFSQQSEDFKKLETSLGALEQGIRELGQSLQQVREELQELERSIQELERSMDELGKSLQLLMQEVKTALQQSTHEEQTGQDDDELDD
jgi:hypothetical protein